MKYLEWLVTVMVLLVLGYFSLVWALDRKYLLTFIAVIVMLGILAYQSDKESTHHKKIQDMDGREFELYCAKILLKKGFRRIETTPISSDYGADLVAYDVYGNKWVFQCKRYSKNVGVKAVQEVNSAKNHYKATKAGVMTNSGFTKNAKQLAVENEIELFEMID